MAGTKKFTAESPKRNNRPAGPNNKGGGSRGGPERWTGNGPAPARHIPWPEIFRHHISVVEGHMRMVDMVRKHTVEGSPNWKMICDLLDRCREMLSMSKHVSRTFVEPPEHREKVPLGSSSASMYPGYSPADHEYGKAAENFGKWTSEAMKHGGKPTLPGNVEYEIGQTKGIKQKTLAKIREAKKQKEASGSSSGSGSGSDNVPSKDEPESSTTAQTTNGNTNPSTAKSGEADQGENPYFVVDTKPMKLNINGVQPPKRKSTSSESLEKKPKRAKKKHDGALPAGEGFEDISGEVDTKLKEKEEKKKRKDEKKKRKRESSGGVPKLEPSNTAEPSPKKRKVKLDSIAASGEETSAPAIINDVTNNVKQEADEKEEKQGPAIKRSSPDRQAGEEDIEAGSPKQKKQKLAHEPDHKPKKRKDEIGEHEEGKKKRKKITPEPKA